MSRKWGKVIPEVKEGYKCLDVGEATRQIHECLTFFFLLSHKHTILQYAYGVEIFFGYNL